MFPYPAKNHLNRANLENFKLIVEGKMYFKTFGETACALKKKKKKNCKSSGFNPFERLNSCAGMTCHNCNIFSVLIIFK